MSTLKQRRRSDARDRRGRTCRSTAITEQIARAWARGRRRVTRCSIFAEGNPGAIRRPGAVRRAESLDRAAQEHLQTYNIGGVQS